jgi:anti-sigma B factor antagonist
MRISTTEQRGIPVLAFEGALTIGDNADAFEKACNETLNGAGHGLVLDFTGLTYLDSAGVGTVVSCAKRGGEQGTVVKIVLKPGGAARRIFKVTQLERAFELFDDVAVAVSSFAY